MEESSYYSCTIKVHCAMCMELRRLIDKITKIYPDIEAARPGASGIKTLCYLQKTIEEGRQLIQNCCESSRFYLAISGQMTLKRCEKKRKCFERRLSELQTMVPSPLASEISQIIADIRSAVFMMDSSEEEAGNIVRALVLKDETFFNRDWNFEIRALQFAAARLHIISPKDLVIEKSSIKKMLIEVNNGDNVKRIVLTRLLRLLKKHDKRVLEDETRFPSLDDQGCFATELYGNKSENDELPHSKSCLGDEPDNPQPDMLHKPQPPPEFKCPISARIMYDPVVIASKQTFERMFIQKWFDEGNETCPVTRMKLADVSLTPHTALRDLISSWCLEHGVNINEPNSKPSAGGTLDVSSNSLSSCSNSLAGLQIPTDLSSVSLGSADTNYSCSIESFSREHTDSKNISRSNSLAFKFFSSTRDLELGILSDIRQFPWESQCTAITDCQSYLDYYNCVRVPLTNGNFIEPIVGFLNDARDKQALEAQKKGVQLLLTGIRLCVSRTAVPFINDNLCALLASLLETEMAKEVLAIFELLSTHNVSRSRLATSGALMSILDTQDKTLLEMSINILYNLSAGIDPQSHSFMPLLDCIPRLVPILCNDSLSGLCLMILKNLCRVEKARILAAGTEGCILAVTGLLGVGSANDQENVVSVLLSMCSQSFEVCRFMMGVDNFMPDLIMIRWNGSEDGKANAAELLRLLRRVIVDDKDNKEGESSAPLVSGGDGLEEPNTNHEVHSRRGSRKRGGLLGSRIAGMLKMKK